MSMPVPVVTLTLHDFGIATGSMMMLGSRPAGALSSIAEKRTQQGPDCFPGLAHHLRRSWQFCQYSKGRLSMGRDLPATVILVTTAVAVAVPVISVPVAVAVIPSISPPAIRGCVVSIPVVPVVGIGVVILTAVSVPVTITVVAVIAVTISIAATMIVPVGQAEQAGLARVERRLCGPGVLPIVDCVGSLCR